MTLNGKVNILPSDFRSNTIRTEIEMIKGVASNKHTNIESLCCTLESNLMLCVDYILVKNKQLISKSPKKVSSRE